MIRGPSHDLTAYVTEQPFYRANIALSKGRSSIKISYTEYRWAIFPYALGALLQEHETSVAGVEINRSAAASIVVISLARPSLSAIIICDHANLVAKDTQD